MGATKIARVGNLPLEQKSPGDFRSRIDVARVPCLNHPALDENPFGFQNRHALNAAAVQSAAPLRGSYVPIMTSAPTVASSRGRTRTIDFAPV